MCWLLRCSQHLSAEHVHICEEEAHLHLHPFSLFIIKTWLFIFSTISKYAEQELFLTCVGKYLIENYFTLHRWKHITGLTILTINCCSGWSRAAPHTAAHSVHRRVVTALIVVTLISSVWSKHSSEWPSVLQCTTTSTVSQTLDQILAFTHPSLLGTGSINQRVDGNMWCRGR